MGFYDGHASASETNEYLNGMSIERQELNLVVEGSSIFLDIQAVGGGNITYYLDNIRYILNCTTGSGVDGKARIEIPQGTSIQPLRSIVYVLYDEQSSELILTTSIALPSALYISVAITSVQDYSTVSSTGALVLQRTTESISHNGKSSISWEREKLRALGAQYWSGVDQSLNITTNPATEDDINFTTTNGEIFQLHRQVFPNYNISTDGIWAMNVSGSGSLTNYQKLTNLNEIHEISDGTSLNSGDSINLVIWGSINYSESDTKLFVTLPTGKYTNDADAISDVNNTSVTVLPREFQTTGFLIARLVLKYSDTNGDTWANLLTKSINTWHTELNSWNTPDYPSSYPNNYDDYLVTLTHPGAEAVRVVFDEFNTEANYDFIRLRNASETDIYSYHGNLGAFTSSAIIGDTIKVYFHSDGSVRRSGVKSSKFEYMTTASSGQEVVDLRGIPTGFN